MRLGWGGWRSSGFGACCVPLLALGACLSGSLSSAQAPPGIARRPRLGDGLFGREERGVQGFGANAGGDVLQAAADGEAATFSSASSLSAEALAGGEPGADTQRHRPQSAAMGAATIRSSSSKIAGRHRLVHREAPVSPRSAGRTRSHSEP